MLCFCLRDVTILWSLFSTLAWSLGAFSIDVILVYTVAYMQLKIQKPLLHANCLTPKQLCVIIITPNIIFYNTQQLSLIRLHTGVEFVKALTYEFETARYKMVLVYSYSMFYLHGEDQRLLMLFNPWLGFASTFIVDNCMC